MKMTDVDEIIILLKKEGWSYIDEIDEMIIFRKNNLEIKLHEWHDGL